MSTHVVCSSTIFKLLNGGIPALFRLESLPHLWICPLELVLLKFVNARHNADQLSPWEESKFGNMPLADDAENVLTARAIWVEMAILVVFTAGLLWHYRAKEVPWLVGGYVFVSWLLGFMGTLLLPADIVLTLLNGEHRCLCNYRGTGDFVQFPTQVLTFYTLTGVYGIIDLRIIGRV